MERSWIDGDESAKEMLQRVLKDGPPFFLLVPPLHRVPLRLGNVIELVGPSPSGKTHILMEAAITCILPREYGGLGHLVIFIDLDCRFDISRLSHLLNHRILLLNANDDLHQLFVSCMTRFLYLRCYDSLQLISTLKTLHYRLQKERETHGVGVRFLIIDNIGAFHWVDRAATQAPPQGNYRKCLSLQSVSEAVVEEIKKLLLVHPMLLISTKTTVLGDKFSTNEAKWNFGKRSSLDTSYSRNISSSTRQPSYREYMPSVWQSFVTHRIIVRATDNYFKLSQHQNLSIYSSEWLLPPLSFSDKFVVKDAGVFIVS
ncbi:hypothetical protein CFOL_v3_09182 [Cephalotus follicularis]|uniref:RecA family profile 1 domain-containing protein n=1 Tax=Cephalotus follicularis TaxID=3775 RepID=A0A1Q3BCH8_CEPFO|nr:hypothetical protein CFOL_v3_09182 [Cephalotus follicularis]